ncbi:MAG: DUF1018 domain-containing protein [Peptostreptococcaceae bacterium]|nr:DUF1018 domain-containing protein [Peptostreptococcaceae bacterium]
MAAITKAQIQKLYALASRVGILESGNKEDPFHDLVYALTKKTSVRSLTDRDYVRVQNELQKRLHRLSAGQKKTEKKETSSRPAGMMSEQQIGKAWHLLYELIHLSSFRKETAGERMVGAVKVLCKVDAEASDPFRWVTAEKGHQLIEGLKRYVQNERRKIQRKQA